MVAQGRHGRALWAPCARVSQVCAPCPWRRMVPNMAEPQKPAEDDWVAEQVRAMPVPSESTLAELRRLLYPAQLSEPGEQPKR